MRSQYINSIIVGLILHLARGTRVQITSDGPVVLGGTINFRADLYASDGSRPEGTFKYSWRDNALNPHTYETEGTRNTTSYWSVSYPANENQVGCYRIEVTVKKWTGLFYWSTWRDLVEIEVTNLLNGNMTVAQSNRTLDGDFVSSKSVSEMKIDLRKGDYDFIAAKATSISTYWFVDCKYFGISPYFTFNYNFTEPNSSHVVEALVIASFEPPATTTVAPTTTTPSATTLKKNSTTAATTSTTPIPKTTTETTERPFGNESFPFVCLNSSVIPPEPKKVYGYFVKKVEVRAPIANITVEGTHWIQPWEMLSLNVSCKGSGPFNKCLVLHPGQYNVTGNETCNESQRLDSCSFSIVHYFLEPNVYTIVVILTNDVSKQISPLTINIYKVTKKAQLSVIIVPVSCSLAAVVLIVFGVAYYIQSRARFNVEVADFDFGQHNPDMEYKTFKERLRDSFNTALRPGGDRISGYEPLNKPLLN